MEQVVRTSEERSALEKLDAWQGRYRFNALLFVEEVLNATPEPWQRRVLVDYDLDRNSERYAVRISIASGHGVGKTALLAWLVVHHMLTAYPQKTAITAPTGGQLWDALWPEITVWLSRVPAAFRGLFEMQAERIFLNASKESAANSFVTAKTSRADQPEALQGVHSGNGYVLLIGDEGSGIPDAVIDAAGGSMSGTRVAFVLAGNPLHGQGFFYDTHHKLSKHWRTYTVSVHDSKWADPTYAEMIEARYGKDSNHYRVRVLGLFPTTDDDTVIPYDWAMACVGREIKPQTDVRPIWGLDVAMEGGHRTALAKRRGNVLVEPPKAWGGLDDAQVAGYVKLEWDLTPADLRPSDINVDAIGYGYGVATRLRGMGLPANYVNVSENPSLKEAGHRNLKTELWFKARAWFQSMTGLFPAFDRDKRVEDLIEELTTVKFGPQKISGKILILDSKGRRSPDLADAWILTFATEAMELTGGKDEYRDWKTAIGKPLVGIV